jgi:uncharacterized surface protein with fasciclin (FAS1) repeats
MNCTSSQNVTIVNATTWRNLFINGITGVLVPPGNLTTALNATNATAAQALFLSAQVPSANGTNETAIEALQEARGMTLFIPNNEAFTCDVNNTLESLQNNQTALAVLLQNHVCCIVSSSFQAWAYHFLFLQYINGTTLYSTQIANESNVTTAAGEPMQFLSNDTGIFLEGANGTYAQVVRPDVLLDNGVAHIIDRFLLVEASDPSAASSACVLFSYHYRQDVLIPLKVRVRDVPSRHKHDRDRPHWHYYIVYAFRNFLFFDRVRWWRRFGNQHRDGDSVSVRSPPKARLLICSAPFLQLVLFLDDCCCRRSSPPWRLNCTNDFSTFMRCLI